MKDEMRTKWKWDKTEMRTRWERDENEMRTRWERDENKIIRIENCKCYDDLFEKLFANTVVETH